MADVLDLMIELHYSLQQDIVFASTVTLFLLLE